MDSFAKDMDIFVKHWATFPRHLPSPCPLDTVGEIKAKDHRVRREFQTCNFSIILRGRGDFRRKGRTWAIEAPCVLTQWPGELVDYGPEDTWDEVFLIYDARTTPWLRQHGFVVDARPVWSIRNLEGVIAQVDELCALSRHPGREPAADRIDRICERLILESLLPDVKARPVPGDQGIQQIAALFRQRPQAPHDFDAIARRHGVSGSTLRRRWFETMKITPGRYLLDLRLQKARRLLAETTMPVGEVAAQSGFQDMFYFSRRFRLETELTPTQYRRRYRVGR